MKSDRHIMMIIWSTYIYPGFYDQIIWSKYDTEQGLFIMMFIWFLFEFVANVRYSLGLLPTKLLLKPFSSHSQLELHSLCKKKAFNVEDQLLCWISEIEIGKEKAAASPNLETENLASKRRSHHPGMREYFFDQWIFHSVWQRFHFQLRPAAVAALLRNIFQTNAARPPLSSAKLGKG